MSWMCFVWPHELQRPHQHRSQLLSQWGSLLPAMLETLHQGLPLCRQVSTFTSIQRLMHIYNCTVRGVFCRPVAHALMQERHCIGVIMSVLECSCLRTHALVSPTLCFWKEQRGTSVQQGSTPIMTKGFERPPYSWCTEYSTAIIQNNLHTMQLSVLVHLDRLLMVYRYSITQRSASRDICAIFHILAGVQIA